jgi:hypothetical protein
MGEKAAQTAVEGLVVHGTDLLGIALDPDWVRSVTIQLTTILRVGTPLLDFPLPDEADPAPVFHA